MPIDSQTTQSFILCLLQFSELYRNCTTYGDNLKQYKFKKFYKVFSILASTYTGIQLNYKKSGRCTIMPIDFKACQYDIFAYI